MATARQCLGRIRIHVDSRVPRTPGFDAVAPHLYPFKECPDPIQTFLSFTESNCQLFGTFQQLLACVLLTVYDCYIVKEQDKVLVEPAF